MTDVISAVSTVGFPIVMCLLLLYYNRENQKQHKEEILNLSKIVQENTVILQQLKELLEIKLVELEDEIP